MYLHTTILGLPEETFWKSTPRKLTKLYEIHKKINGIEDEEELGNIDDINF